MRATGPVRRQPKDSFLPPPTPLNLPRDSDVSLVSSRPSSVGITSLDLYKDRSFQQSSISTINSFLSSHNFPVSFKPSSSPSAKDIHQTLGFLLRLVDFPTNKIEDDLPLFLKYLNYPFKINKSILKSPAAPHQWPSILALIHWLVQISKYHLSLSHSNSTLHNNNVLFDYTLNSYLNFIRGDDDAIAELRQKIDDRILKEKSDAAEKLRAAEQNFAELEAQFQRLRSEPSRKDALDKEKLMLEDDVKKFHHMIESLNNSIKGANKVLEDKEKQLEAKVLENERFCEEKEELKKKVELQTFNVRDVERMKRELQAAERDAGEAELARYAWEEKCWEVDNTLSQKFKDLEALSIDCNQSLKRLKIGLGIVLNPKGTTPAEIMGIDYKSTLKPALNSLADDIKKSSVGKLEELISLQQKSSENAARLEAKRNKLAAVQSCIDEIEAQMNMKKKETQDYTSGCSAEAKKVFNDVQEAEHDVEIMEREVAEILKASELKLQETVKQSEEEIQMHALKVLNLVDSVSKYKEHVESKISEMKRDLSETVTAVSDAYRGSFSAQFGYIFEASRQPKEQNK